MKNRKIDKPEIVGEKIYYVYFGFKLVIFLLNIFFVYSILKNHQNFVMLNLIVNIIYLLLYNRRLIMNILVMSISYYIFKDILTCTSLGFSLGNIISYVIDLVVRKFYSLLFKIFRRLDK